MKRRHFIQGAITTVAISQAGGSLGAEAWIEKINQYFNSVKTAFAPFTQIDANGAKASGKFFLQKPGKMRFEYDQKEYPLTVADGTTIAIFDPKSNSGAQRYPQNQTPVSLLSKSNVDLTSSKFVRKINQSNGEAIITMADPDRPQYGSLLVRVNMSNPKIKGWQSIDGSGARTTVNFAEFHEGVAMNPDLFSIVKIKNSR